MIHAQIYCDVDRKNYGYEIWDGSNRLHESKCIYSEEVAKIISNSVINELTYCEKELISKLKQNFGE